MTADRRAFDAQYGSNLSAVAAKCRELEAENKRLEAENRELRAKVARQDRIITAVRAACREHFAPNSRYGLVFARALGDAL